MEILKALYRGVDILILDEPTAVLTPSETKELFENLRRLRDDGKTIVFISHKLDEVLRDRRPHHGAAARRGRGRDDAGGDVKAALAEMMVGRPVLFRLDKPQVEVGRPVLRARRSAGRAAAGPLARGPRGRDRRGRGCRGQRAARARRRDHGAAAARRGARSRSTARDLAGDEHARRSATPGSAFVPEDRHDQGLVLDMTLWENAVIGRHDDAEFSSGRGVLFIKKMKELATRLIAPVRRADAEHRRRRRGTLSGGNQQKLILARELETDPEAAARRPAHAWARRRSDRVRLEPDPRAEGRGSSRPADLGRARRDLRARRIAS